MTEQLPFVGSSRTQLLPFRLQGAPQALNEGSFAYRNVHHGNRFGLSPPTLYQEVFENIFTFAAV